MKPRCARLGKLCPSPVPPWAQEEDLRESSVDQGRGAKARKTATRQGGVPTASRGVRWGAARLHGEGGGRVQAPVLWDSAACHAAEGAGDRQGPEGSPELLTDSTWRPLAWRGFPTSYWRRRRTRECPAGKAGLGPQREGH